MSQIKRRHFIDKTIKCAAGVSMAAMLSPEITNSAPITKKSSKRPSKPNIIFIFADQLRYSALGSSGNDIVHTPNLDSLAEQGVVFDQAFSSCPICSPYRAQLITGRYAHKNGVVCNEYKPRTDQVTLHQALKREGYHTAHIGKWHLGYGPFTEEKRYGLDYMFANTCDHRYYNVKYYENEKGPIETHEWSPVVETSKVIEFIEEHVKKNDESPFSVHLGYGPPHNGYGGSKHLPYDMYPGKFNIYDPAKIELRPNVPTALADFTRNEIADYYANITGLDDQVGRILAKLDELGISDNTIVCFSSDHGDHLRSHGYGGPGDRWLHHTKRANKATPHEEAIHIPFIVRYPEKAKGGSRTQCMFNSVDVMPTLLGLCGIDIPEGVQGKDLSHAIRGEKGFEPDSVYLQILGPGWPHRGRWVGYWRGVRTNRWLYARWYDPDQYEYGIWLFDRENDPYEMHNLAGNKEYSKIENELETLLNQWMSDTDDPFDTGERDPKTKMLSLGQEFTNEKYYR